MYKSLIKLQQEGDFFSPSLPPSPLHICKQVLRRSFDNDIMTGRKGRNDTTLDHGVRAIKQPQTIVSSEQGKNIRPQHLEGVIGSTEGVGDSSQLVTGQRWSDQVEQEEEELVQHSQGHTRDKLEELMELLCQSMDKRGENRFGNLRPIPPKAYMGTRNSLVLNRWLRECSNFLVQSKVQLEEWVIVAATFLDGPAAHWYLSNEELYANYTWGAFKESMRHYFIPQNEQLTVMDEWRNIRQGDSLMSNYIDKYRQLMLRLPQMDQLTRLHGFLAGLKVQTKLEIQMQKPQDLETAIGLAESIGDLVVHTQPYRPLNNFGAMGKTNVPSFPNSSRTSGVQLTPNNTNAPSLG